MKPEERARLIDDLLDGELSEADFLRLEAEMIVSEEARTDYYDRQKLHTGLHLEANENATGVAGQEVPGKPAGARHRLRLDRFAVTAILLLVALVGVVGWKVGQDSQAAEIANEPVVFGFGVLAAESDLQWSEEPVLREGDLIEKGLLKMESGIAKLEFFNGVEVVLSGPSGFEVLSDLQFKLEYGEALFRIPKSVTEVSVEIPSGRVANLISEVFVGVDQRSQRVEVISGSADWEIHFEEARRVGAGKGLQLDEEGQWQALDQTAGSMREVESRLSQKVGERRKLWNVMRRSMMKQDRVIAWYFLDEEAPSRFRMAENSGSQADGEIIRSRIVENRWGEPSGAVDFSPTGSRVRVDIPGSFPSLTLVCWVKIDSLDRQFNSLFLTDGHEKFEPHWQLMDDGRIFFSVKAQEGAAGPDKHIAYSPSIWNPSRVGHWMQIATVFNGEEQTISHYRNGARVSEESIPEDLVPAHVQIGAASIGNWSQPRYRQTPEFAIRNLNGTMDELMLFSEPLSYSEIRILYFNGKP